MSYSSHRQRRPRLFQPEMLERRELLSTVAGLGHQPAEVVPLAKVHEVITGTMTGVDSVEEITLQKGTVTFGARGTLTILGLASQTGSESYNESKRGAIKYSNGSAILEDSSFDMIDTKFTGSGKQTGADSFSFKFKGKVTGGSGTYSGAAGKVSASGSSVAEVFSITLTVTLTRV
jgi:hypothetical protein